MTRIRRFALAAALAASLGAAGTAQAQSEENCAERLVKLEAQFRDQEARHGWEAAAEWWQPRWKAYHTSCVIH
jgi:hypothetical protein